MNESLSVFPRPRMSISIESPAAMKANLEYCVSQVHDDLSRRFQPARTRVGGPRSQDIMTPRGLVPAARNC